MRKRAEQMEETRRRITEAAMRLHTSIGPANTTISGVADEAGVTRVTVYRHFPDEEQLFLACSAHWAMLHPGPDAGSWAEVDGLEERTRYSLGELYAWYRENHADLYPILRDFEAMPTGFREALAEEMAAYAEALVASSGRRGSRRDRLRAVAGLVTSFWTWRSLALEHDLDDTTCVDVATGFVLSV